MADKPWRGKVLRREQVVQLLESLHCRSVRRITETSEMWRTPTGRHFSISYDEIDADVLEAIVERIKQWIRETPSRQD